MDSLTQFVLGAGVGVAVMGRRIGVRRAALTGGILGTLPDLDVFWPIDDPVDSFVSHRGFTHSLIIHALATPVIGEGLFRLFKNRNLTRSIAYAAVFLCLSTHALLDAMTIYGTQLFWPVSRDPVGLGSIFIIDPLYTVPLLIMVIWALITNRWSQKFRRGLTVAFVFSTGYLLWTAVAQQWVQAQARTVLDSFGQPHDILIATPTPFNSVFWRTIAVSGDSYINIYIPLLGNQDAITAYRQQRIPPELACGPAEDLIKNGNGLRLALFTDGFYRFDMEANRIVMSDLRMGITHDYVFRFAIAERNGSEIIPIAPDRILDDERFDGDTNWLISGIRGVQVYRDKERANLLDRAERINIENKC